MRDDFSRDEYKQPNRIVSRNSQYRSRDALKTYQYKNKMKKGSTALVLLAAIFGVLVIAVFVVFGVVKLTSTKLEEQVEKNWSKEQMKNDIYVDFSLIGMTEPLSLRGKTKQEIYDQVLGSYEWNLKIKNSNPEIDLFTMPSTTNQYEQKEDLEKNLYVNIPDADGTSQEIMIDNPYSDITIEATKETYDFPNFLDKQLMSFIDNVYNTYLHKSMDKKKNSNVDEEGYIIPDETFVVDENDIDVDDYIAQLARLWNTKATLGMVEGYDSKRNEFTFGDEHMGYEIDQGKLRQNIYNEVKNGKFTANIWTPINMVAPVGESIKSKYKYSSIYETTTTDDAVRNTNIQLACKKLNGTIVKAGEEFSFNRVIGERTSEKGYGYANAYVGGEVVQELGGGVCQVSTTLYNAIFGAGLTTTYRRSHTFEPSYVTPGLDATVSFNGVDYRFINDSDYSIGIRASYGRKKCKVEIFSVPKLEKGQRQYLTAKKIEDLGYPDISIIDSGTPTKGTKGSEWQVFKVVKDGDKEIERIFDHSAKYVGHAPTAYEVDTYIDDEGKIQTSKFTGKIPQGARVATKASNNDNNNNDNVTTRRSTRATTRRQNTTSQTTAPRETTMPMPLPLAPGQGASNTPNAQAISPNQSIITPY